MDDFKWFLGLLAIVAMVWFTGRSVGTNPTSSETASSTTETQTATLGGSESEQKTATLGQEVSQTPVDPNASTLKGKLTIVAHSQGSSADQEYVLIQASPENEKPVIITGLTIGSATSHTKQSIPKGWILPFLGATGAGDLVSLAPGERAYIISGHSPLALSTGQGNATSFQLNKCTGFLAQGTNYYPSLPRECPAPSEEPLPGDGYELSYACIDYLRSIPRCTVPGTIPLSLSADTTCDVYTSTKINYGQCITNHKNDSDFYKGEWRLYLGRSKPLWQSSRESIELRDMIGKLIDVRAY